jgi:hypothetical protein
LNNNFHIVLYGNRQLKHHSTTGKLIVIKPNHRKKNNEIIEEMIIT